MGAPRTGARLHPGVRETPAPDRRKRHRTITIDGVETVELGTGEHVTIPIAAGEHLVGVKGVVEITLGRIHKTQAIQAEPGCTDHFRVEHGMIDRVPETEGRELVAKTTALTPQPK